MGLTRVRLRPSLKVLLEKLASGELLEFLRRVGMDAQLKEWRTTLLMIQAVHTDAENKQIRDDEVNDWLRDLDSLVYKLDSLVNKLLAEASRRNARDNKGSTSMIRKLIPTFCTNHSSYLADFMLYRRISPELKKNSDRLRDLAKEISRLDLVENVRETPYGTGERFQLASFMDESEQVSPAYSLS